MRVLKFAWHLFWASRRCPHERLGQLLCNADFLVRRDIPMFYKSDYGLTEALRRYGR